MSTDTPTAERPVPPIVFVDTETTGVGPDRVPWEIAVVRRAPDGTETEHRWFLPLDDVSRVDGFALRVGRFWDRHPSGRFRSGQWEDDRYPPMLGGSLAHPAEVARVLFRLTHGAIWVGANPAFDADLIERLLRQHGLQPTWDYHLVDTGTLLLGWAHALATAGVLDPPPVKYRSDDLAALCGVEPAADVDRHTALGDARWCQRIYDRITGSGRAA